MKVKYLDKEIIEANARKQLEDAYGQKLYSISLKNMDIEAVVEKLGYEIQYVNLSRDKSILGRSIFFDEAIEVYDDNRIDKHIIYVNANTILIDEDAIGNNEGRLAFTIAHELGHLILHQYYYNQKSKIDYCVAEDVALYNGEAVDNTKSLEWQADYFAGCILAPKSKVKTKFYEYWDKGYNALDIVILLSKDFSLSKEAMKIRLSNLGLM